MNAPIKITDRWNTPLEVGDRVKSIYPSGTLGSIVNIFRPERGRSVGHGRSVGVQWDDMRQDQILDYQPSELLYAGNGLELMLKLVP